jgi:hypothetical protein
LEECSRPGTYGSSTTPFIRLVPVKYFHIRWYYFFLSLSKTFLVYFWLYLENGRTSSEKSRVSRRSPRGNGIQSRYLCSGSVTFWSESIPANSCLWLTHPHPDPGLFVSDIQDTNKKYFFCLLLFEGIFTSFVKDKNSWRSHKTVEIKVFLTFFAWWWKDPEPDLYLWLMDPDPGGSKICGSGSGTLPGTGHNMVCSKDRFSWRCGWKIDCLYNLLLFDVAGCWISELSVKFLFLTRWCGVVKKSFVWCFSWKIDYLINSLLAVVSVESNIYLLM